MNNKELILIMDNLPVGILRFDKDKTFIYANKFVIKPASYEVVLDICQIVEKHI